MIKKTVNIKVKVNFQPPLKTRKIDSKYQKGYRPTKKDKNKTNQNYQNKNKTKSSYNPPFANLNQPQTQSQTFKKDKYH